MLNKNNDKQAGWENGMVGKWYKTIIISMLQGASPYELHRLKCSSKVKRFTGAALSVS